jgi:hypothetical protein
VNPVLCEEARILASRIAGPDASVYITALALRVAEAGIDLRRVRTARQSFLSKRLSDSHYPPPEKEQIGLRQLKAPAISTPAATELASHPLAGPMKLAGIVLWETESILRMDRYERRARSRLRLAIRDFDEARS